jgi:Na+-driven multidrug efflux pump
MMFVFFQNIQPVTIMYFSATGNNRQGLLVSLSRQGLFLIPLLVILPRFFGINGILAASPISDTMAFIMSVSMVLLSFKRLSTLGPNDSKKQS